MTYSTLSERKIARELGYEHHSNPQSGCSFKQTLDDGERRVWAILYSDRPPTMGWQTADVVGGRFRNHLAFKSLQKALERPIDFSAEPLPWIQGRRYADD